MASSSPPLSDARHRWTLGGLHFLVILAFTWARIARDGVLLSRIDVTWVPWLTVAVLVATAAVTPLVAALARRRDAAVGFARVAVATGVALVVAQALLPLGQRWSAALLYVGVGAYGPLLVAQFWILVHARLRADQARDLIGVIGALGIVGGAVAGLVLSSVAGALPLDAWLTITAVVHGLAAVVALRVPGTSLVTAPGTDPLPGGAIVSARDVLREAGYARLLAAVLVIGAAVGGIVDYQFKLALQQQSTDAVRLGQWLGAFNIAVNVVALGTQLLTTVLLARFGSRWLALTLPTGVVAGAAAGVVLPGLWPAVLTRLWENAARHSVARTASEFFFFPFQGERRVAMKHAAEGFLTRAGEVLASALLVVLTTMHLAEARSLSLLTLALGGAWLALVIWLGRAYGPALSASLDQLLRPGQATAEGDATRTLPVEELVALLGSRDARHVRFALEELAVVDVARARREARRLLSHASPDVRQQARQLQDRAPLPVPAPEIAVPPLPAQLLDALRGDDDTCADAASARVVAEVDRSAVPTLLHCLSGRSRLRARDTLVALGDAIVGTLGDTLVDRREPLRMRRDVALVLARIGTPAALAQLQRVRRDDPPGLRSLALRGLDAARKRGAAVVVDADAVRHEISADLATLVARQQQRAGLDAADALGLLPRALDEAVAVTREHAFRRLALLYPAREMLRAQRGLASDDPRIRAFALEYLDATLLPEDRERVLSALRVPLASQAIDPDALVETLAADADPWIATLAGHVREQRRARALRSPSRERGHA